MKALLSSRERVLKALNHQEADRVPIDIGGISNLTTLHKDAYANLLNHLGIDEKIIITSTLSQSALPGKAVRERFKADCLPIYVTGPSGKELDLKQDEDGAAWYVDEWGIKWKKPARSIYFDPVEHPLAGCTIEDINRYPWPDFQDISRIKGLKEQAADLYENSPHALVLNGPFYGGVYVPCQWLVGYEDFFIKLMEEPHLVKKLLDIVVDYHIQQWGLILDEVGKYVQVAVLSDDLGTQNAPIMNPKIYREVIKPYQKKLVDFIKSKADLKIVYHCDGAVTNFIDDFIELGLDAWNPVQVSAAGLDDTAELKRNYGDKIAFWGASCDSQLVLSRKSPEEIRQEVKRRVYDLAPGGGLVLSSIHNIQKDVPPENMVAFYDALYEYGTEVYR